MSGGTHKQKKKWSSRRWMHHIFGNAKQFLNNFRQKNNYKLILSLLLLLCTTISVCEFVYLLVRFWICLILRKSEKDQKKKKNKTKRKYLFIYSVCLIGMKSQCNLHPCCLYSRIVEWILFALIHFLLFKWLNHLIKLYSVVVFFFLFVCNCKWTIKPTYTRIRNAWITNSSL